MLGYIVNMSRKMDLEKEWMDSQTIKEIFKHATI